MAGKTDIPQLAALLKLSDLLVTVGYRADAYRSVAAGTPVVAMFLASAYALKPGRTARATWCCSP